MADKEISALTAGTAPGGAEVFHGQQGGNSRKFTATQLHAASGTAFPGSPSTDDVFYRTDRRIEYFYDGTRWLSTQLHTLVFTGPGAGITATAATHTWAANPWADLYDIYVEELVGGSWFTAAANWTFGVEKVDANVFTSIGTVVLSVGAVGEDGGRSTINAVVASTVGTFRGSATENSGSATAHPTYGFTYRLVG